MEFGLVPEDQETQEEGKEESSNLQKNRRWGLLPATAFTQTRSLLFCYL